MHILTVDDTADLDPILPGFKLQIGEWFAEMDKVFESNE